MNSPRTIRCVVLGDSEVGKTALCHRLAKGYFVEEHFESTLCCKYTVPPIEATIGGRSMLLSFEIWEFPGVRAKWNKQLTDISRIDCVLFCFAVNLKLSWSHIANWCKEVKEKLPRVATILVGLKSDKRPTPGPETYDPVLVGDQMVSLNEAFKVQKENNIDDYFECSSQTGAGVKDLFIWVAEMVIRYNEILNGTFHFQNSPFRKELQRQQQLEKQQESSATKTQPSASGTTSPSGKTTTQKNKGDKKQPSSSSEPTDEELSKYPILDIAESTDVETKELEKKLKRPPDAETDTTSLLEDYQRQQITNAESHETQIALLDERENVSQTKEFHKLLEKVRSSASIVRRLLKAHGKEVLPLYLMVASHTVDVLDYPWTEQYMDILVKIEKNLEEYTRLLHTLVKKKMLDRWVKNFRTRKYLDKLASAMYITCDTLARKVGYEPKHPSPVKIAKIITNEDAKKFWRTSFGPNTLIVRWETFLPAWQATFETHGSITHMVPFIRYTLDVSYTNTVNQFALQDFVHKFGPFHECLERAEKVWKEPWFVGYMTSHEAGFLLEKEPVGTFLIRYANSAPFALEYVDTRGNVKHSTIQYTSRGTYVVEEATADASRPKKPKEFPDLGKLVENYTNFLFHRPYRKNIFRKSWFFGEATSSDCTVLLAEKRDGTFLIRFSQNKRGSFVVSYVHHGKLFHTMIDTELDGSFLCDGVRFKSLDEMLYKYRSLFVFPMFTFGLPYPPNYKHPSQQPQPQPQPQQSDLQKLTVDILLRKKNSDDEDSSSLVGAERFLISPFAYQNSASVTKTSFHDNEKVDKPDTLTRNAPANWTQRGASEWKKGSFPSTSSPNLKIRLDRPINLAEAAVINAGSSERNGQSPGDTSPPGRNPATENAPTASSSTPSTGTTAMTMPTPPPTSAAMAATAATTATKTPPTTPTTRAMSPPRAQISTQWPASVSCKFPSSQQTPQTASSTPTYSGIPSSNQNNEGISKPTTNSQETANTSNEAPVDPQALKILLNIGFAEPAARRALAKAGGDVSKAVQLLIEEAQNLLSSNKANVVQQSSQK